MRFDFHPDALVEYEAAARHYTACQDGLEIRFIAAVEHAIQLILASPNRWAVLEEDVRRCLIRIFPYAILYTVEPDYVLVIAVMHSHREPAYWQNRLD
ncbi:MAG: type II toxin-antitoxin system RelE/ParE family toxin [Thiobacillaceae bacterium]